MRMMETPRLALRLFTLQDAETVWRLSGEEAYRRWLPDQVYINHMEAEEALAFLISKYNEREMPYVLAVEEKVSGELIGHVGLSRIPQGVEIGYAIGQRYQQRGYACEAVAAFTGWAKKEFELDLLYGVVHSGNGPSQRVLEKAGFTRLAGDITPAGNILYMK